MTEFRRCLTARSAVLRTEPIFVVSALRAAATIARKPNMPTTSPRIERARAQLDRLRKEAAEADRRVAQFGPHCRACRYSSYGGKSCLHPVNQTVRVDAFGKATVEGEKRTRDMRDDAGLCGPEASLFDPRPILFRIPLLIVAGVILAAILLYFAFTVRYGEPIGMFAVFGIALIVAEWSEGRYS